jgi:hypothetical protein
MRPVRFFYPSFIPNGIGAAKQEISVEKNDNGFNRRAVRHVISVEKVKADFVPSHTGRDIFRIKFFYLSLIPNGISAVRHVISVEKVKADFVSSHTGRDISRIEFFYPSFIPNGIDRNSISKKFKELAI